MIPLLILENIIDIDTKILDILHLRHSNNHIDRYPVVSKAMIQKHPVFHHHEAEITVLPDPSQQRCERRTAKGALKCPIGDIPIHIITKLVVDSIGLLLQCIP